MPPAERRSGRWDVRAGGKYSLVENWPLRKARG